MVTQGLNEITSIIYMASWKRSSDTLNLILRSGRRNQLTSSQCTLLSIRIKNLFSPLIPQLWNCLRLLNSTKIWNSVVSQSKFIEKGNMASSVLSFKNFIYIGVEYIKQYSAFLYSNRSTFWSMEDYISLLELCWLI